MPSQFIPFAANLAADDKDLYESDPDSGKSQWSGRKTNRDKKKDEEERKKK